MTRSNTTHGAAALSMLRAIVTRAVLVTVAIPAALGVLGACGGSQGDVCDPATIEVGGRCFWTKETACDAASCLPPAECVLIEDKPAKVECHQPE